MQCTSAAVVSTRPVDRTGLRIRAGQNLQDMAYAQIAANLFTGPILDSL
jgi:hypothetical protein